MRKEKSVAAVTSAAVSVSVSSCGGHGDMEKVINETISDKVLRVQQSWPADGTR